MVRAGAPREMRSRRSRVIDDHNNRVKKYAIMEIATTRTLKVFVNDFSKAIRALTAFVLLTIKRAFSFC